MIFIPDWQLWICLQIKPDDEFLLSPGKLADHPDKNDLWDMVFIVPMSF
jgi:hypothetical protein